MVVSRGFELPEELPQEAVVSLVRQCIKPGEVSKGNGRLVRNMVRNHHLRL